MTRRNIIIIIYKVAVDRNCTLHEQRPRQCNYGCHLTIILYQIAMNKRNVCMQGCMFVCMYAYKVDASRVNRAGQNGSSARLLSLVVGRSLFPPNRRHSAPGDSAGFLLRPRRSNDETPERNDRTSGRYPRHQSRRRNTEPINDTETPVDGSDIAVAQPSRKRGLRSRNRNRNRNPVEHSETPMDRDMRISKGVHPGMSPRVMNRRRLESTEESSMK